MSTATRPIARISPWSRLRSAIPWRGLITHAVALLFILWFILPFSWVVITSFMTEAEALSVPPNWIPQEGTFDNYLAFFNPSVLKQHRFVGQGAAQDAPRALINSATVALTVAVLNIILGSLAGYSFARLSFRGATALIVFYLASRMVPAVAIMVSIYLIMQTFGLLDTLLSLIVAYTAFTIPYSIWILQSYFRTIPHEIEDAARVDGCNWLQMMVRVFLPLAIPGLITVAMFAFMASWGEFLYALLFTSTMASKTMPIIVSQFVTDQDTSPTLMNAGGVLAVIPPLVLALIFQRMIISGLTAGSTKG